MIPMFPSPISETRPLEASGGLLSKILSLRTPFFCILRFHSQATHRIPHQPRRMTHTRTGPVPGAQMETANSPSRAVRNPFEREAFVTWRAAGVLTGCTNAGMVSEELRTRDGLYPSTAMFSGPGFRQGAPPPLLLTADRPSAASSFVAHGTGGRRVGRKAALVHAARSRLCAGSGNSTAAAGLLEPHIRPGGLLGVMSRPPPRPASPRSARSGRAGIL
jgi:hypothetical protein